jgi:hypothetical protein
MVPGFIFHLAAAPGGTLTTNGSDAAVPARMVLYPGVRSMNFFSLL